MKGYDPFSEVIVDRIVNQVHTLAENCEDFQGFMIYYGLGGSTGSRLSTLVS
jgi:hypothetical protein